MLKLENCRIKNGEFSLRADFSITEKTTNAIIGPSGAGKSTLIEAIAGFREVDTGTISWQSRDLTNESPTNRPVAMLFQDGNLFPHLTAFQNIALGLQPNRRLSDAETNVVIGALSRVGLADLGARKPSELSGGQQSRVALARVLVQNRDLLLLDEPFAALGPALKDEMLDLVKDIVVETGATLLMISHDPSDARRIAEQTILVADGYANPPKDTTTLLDNPPDVLKDYLGR